MPMSRRRRLLSLTLAVAGLGVAAPAPAQELELTEAELFFELNDTDGDLGIHASVDGGPYTELAVEDPRGRTILEVAAAGRLARQGLTQLFIESAEPGFDELPPEAFFRRFPEGVYTIEVERGRKEAEAKVRLSHVLAAPPSHITVNGIPAAESCDSPDLPEVSGPVRVDWDPVTTSHPEVGRPGPVEIVRYQFFAEQGATKLAVDLPPTATEFEVPEEITAKGGVFKFEIIARTARLNNTAIESCARISHEVIRPSE
jgi:hypothetical protein